MTTTQTHPEGDAYLEKLTSNRPRFLLVAPVQDVKDGEPVLYHVNEEALTREAFPSNDVTSQRFSSRHDASAPFSNLSRPEGVSRRAIEAVEARSFTSTLKDASQRPVTLRARILAAEVFRHFDMDIFSVFIEFDEAGSFKSDEFWYFSELDIECLETATTALVKTLAEEHYADPSAHEVRWVGRTLIIPEWANSSGVKHKEHLKAPDGWFQGPENSEPIQIDQRLQIALGWGNSVAWPRKPDYPFIDVRRSTVMAQFLWSFISDIETRSLHMLYRVNRVTKSKRQQDRAMDDLIDLNYDLAVASMFFERMGMEGSAANRTLVVEILETWGYHDAMGHISARIERLEKIMGTRSEMLSRRSNRIMEGVLFLLSATGIVSLVLGFIGTAFSGESGADKPWHPSGFFFTIFRNMNADVALIGAALLSIAIVVAVFYRPKKVQQRRER